MKPLFISNHFFSTAIVVVILMLVSLPAKATADQDLDINRFIPAATCADCHSEIYSQWQGSLHSLSHTDPIYNKLARYFLTGLSEPGEIEEAESCVKCHTPVGYVSGFPRKMSDNLSQTPEIATRGIQCDYCHSAVDVKKMYNNGLVVSPGQGEEDPGTKYGPFDDAQPDFHEAAYSKLHTEARICGTCHDVKHVAFGTNLETTYTEWKNSPYNSEDPEKRVTCQDCHMVQRPGVPATGSTSRPDNPGSAADYSDERPHIFTHYFVGANTYVPARFNAQEKSDMAIERLRNAAVVKIDTVTKEATRIRVSVTNSGAGHSIPTGLGDLRQVWLEIVVKDETHKVLYTSGRLDRKGILDSDALIFRTVFGDKAGNPVINLAKASQVLSDNRIRAGETVTIPVDLGFAPPKGSVISVRLLYRGAPQKILAMLPGPSISPLPVIEMARAVQKF